MIAQWFRIKLWNFLAPLLNDHLNQCVRTHLTPYNEWVKEQESHRQEQYKIQAENSDVLKKFGRDAADSTNNHKEFMGRLDKLVAAIEAKI